MTTVVCKKLRKGHGLNKTMPCVNPVSPGRARNAEVHIVRKIEETSALD